MFPAVASVQSAQVCDECVPPCSVPVHTVVTATTSAPFSSLSTLTAGEAASAERSAKAGEPSVRCHGPLPAMRESASVDDDDSQAVKVAPSLPLAAAMLHRRSPPSRPSEPPPAVRRSPLKVELVTNTRFGPDVRSPLASGVGVPLDGEQPANAINSVKKRILTAPGNRGGRRRS